MTYRHAIGSQALGNCCLTACADIVIGCAATDIPSAIHREKPMATTWADCREMVEPCETRGSS